MDDEEDEKIKKVLLRAADLVQVGWVQGTGVSTREGVPVDLVDDERAERFCVLGAIRRAIGDYVPKGYYLSSSEIGLEIQRVRAVFIRSVGVESAATWNDDPKRTQSEVVAALRRAAAEARDEGMDVRVAEGRAGRSGERWSSKDRPSPLLGLGLSVEVCLFPDEEPLPHSNEPPRHYGIYRCHKSGSDPWRYRMLRYGAGCRYAEPPKVLPEDETFRLVGRLQGDLS